MSSLNKVKFDLFASRQEKYLFLNPCYSNCKLQSKSQVYFASMQAIFMVNIMIWSKCLKLGDIQGMSTISSLETMLTAAKNPSNVFVYYWPTKLNILRTSSCSEATMNVQVLTVYMDFTINAKESIIWSFGKFSLMSSMLCL